MTEKKSRPVRKSLTAIEMYKFFKKKHPDEEVSYLLFKETISRFNKKMSDEILKGYTFNPGFRLGRIRIKKVRRTFKATPPIDWAESKKLKAQGVEKYLVYFTDPYWYRWYWEKKKCVIKNKTVYSFQPTVSNSRKDGNRNKLVKILQSDPLAALRYGL
jgi:hypothetical protein